MAAKKIAKPIVKPEPPCPICGHPLVGHPESNARQCALCACVAQDRP